jgi:hypothetical protein
MHASRARYLEFLAASGVLTAAPDAASLVRSRWQRCRVTALDYLRRVVRTKR